MSDSFSYTKNYTIGAGALGGPKRQRRGLLTNQPPAAVEATPGMWYTAFAGYPQTSATGVTFAPETRLAWANDPSLLPAFTSETVIGGPFGRNRAAAFPMTHSSTLVNYGANGVSAATNAPATSPGGSIISVLPTIGGAAARAADQVLFGGWGGTIAKFVGAGAGAAIELAATTAISDGMGNHYIAKNNTLKKIPGLSQDVIDFVWGYTSNAFEVGAPQV